MTVRGTKNLIGEEAATLLGAINRLRIRAEGYGCVPFIPSALCEADLFNGQIGDNRMYEFKDRGDRNLCLTPEITAIVRREYRENWKALPKPIKLWYCSKCYRYDRPQRGRWREFWQFGIEMLGPKAEPEELKLALFECMQTLGFTALNAEWRPLVQRGLAYYVEDGFEVWADGLQLAGGGRYDEGIGFAIGVDRCLLVKNERDGLKGEIDG